MKRNKSYNRTKRVVSPMLTREHQFFTPVEVGRLAIWQVRDTLTLSITFAPTCPTCEQRVVGHYYVRLM